MALVELIDLDDLEDGGRGARSRKATLGNRAPPPAAPVFPPPFILDGPRARAPRRVIRDHHRRGSSSSLW